MNLQPDINLPAVVSEVMAAVTHYQQALLDNELETLDSYFWDSPHTIRFGVAENLYGAEDIASYRRICQPVGPGRQLRNPVVTTLGQDYATVSTEFIDGETSANANLGSVRRRLEDRGGPRQCGSEFAIPNHAVTLAGQPSGLAFWPSRPSQSDSRSSNQSWLDMSVVLDHYSRRIMAGPCPSAWRRSWSLRCLADNLVPALVTAACHRA